MSSNKTVIVLGGYGLIGSVCMRALQADGFNVIGVGRSTRAARRMSPAITWRVLDLAKASIEDLRVVMSGADVVVNAAGALQDGLRDDCIAIHETLIEHLVAALERSPARVIQISAAGVSTASSTEFFRSKARGDALLMGSDLDWVVLRPTLVLSRDAYGGTALLRASAAMPLVALDVAPQSPVQTVAVDDVAAAVVAAARGTIARGTLADLTESESQDFAALVRTTRAWLGLPPWRFKLRIPPGVLGTVAKIADGLGHLGWRSPLRTTALTVLSEGIGGDPTAWRKAGGAPCRPLADTFAAMPATGQDRWFARLYLLLPVIIATLALLWLLSGAIGIIRNAEAVRVLTSRGWAQDTARVVVIAGALADIALGIAILVRRFARTAALGMVAVALAYLIGASLFAADLWTDPLGPLAKILPAITLSLVAAAILDDR